MEALWRVELFGGLRLKPLAPAVSPDGNTAITRFRTQKTAALLAYLAYYRERAHPREVLTEILWPEEDGDATRHKLSVALSSLRRQLEPPGVPGGAADGSVLIAEHFSVRLNPVAVTTDVAEFEASLRAAARSERPQDRADSLVGAVGLYAGELLPAFYEDWIPGEQQRLSELFYLALRQLIAHCEQSGQIDQAIQYALQAIRSDSLREEAHQQLMRLYAAAGRPAAARRHYRELERILDSEYGSAPCAASQAIAREVAATAALPPPTSAVDEGSAAPPPLSRFDTAPPTPDIQHSRPYLEPEGGAVPLDSPFYIVREADETFRAAVHRRDSIVLVKGASHVGKTSLLARGLQQARQQGARVVQTDLHQFNADRFESAGSLLLTLAESVADQLELDVLPAEVPEALGGPNVRLLRYLGREVLGKMAEASSAGTGAAAGSLVWGLDGVDRLFPCPFGQEVFALFRSWHNGRALDPEGPWSRLTLAIAYATEAHLFITDLNQSPFNVGTRLTIGDFSLEQVDTLNRRYGSPLKRATQVARFYGLVGGHPYLVRRGLHALADEGVDLAAMEDGAAAGQGIFADHLQRMLTLLVRDAALSESVRRLLDSGTKPGLASFYRLRSAGVLVGNSAQDARFRCELYAAYLAQHLSSPP